MQAEKDGFDTYMMTPDKDYGSFVDLHTFIYKPVRLGNGAVLGVNEVCKRWEIERVDQVKDILGLMGDSVGQHSGIPGVGENRDTLIKHSAVLRIYLKTLLNWKESWKKKLSWIKKAIQSKRLATIILDVPVKQKPDDLQAVEPNREALRELFAELEFEDWQSNWV